MRWRKRKNRRSRDLTNSSHDSHQNGSTDSLREPALSRNLAASPDARRQCAGVFVCNAIISVRTVA